LCSLKTYRASMTVEAAFIIPFFLFCFLNLISIIEMYRLHANMTASLWKTGRILCQYSYLYQPGSQENVLVDKAVSGLFSEIYIKAQIKADLARSQKAELVLKGGVESISLAGTSVMDKSDDIIELHAAFQAVPFLAAYPGHAVRQEASFYGHTWTGYALTGQTEETEKEDEYVYITETGSVYHRNRHCTYLNPGIIKIMAEETESKRNLSGGKYEKCPLCKPTKQSKILYITPYGEAYHSSEQCSALKRTIYQIRFSEVGSRDGCSKCS